MGKPTKKQRQDASWEITARRMAERVKSEREKRGDRPAALAENAEVSEAHCEGLESAQDGNLACTLSVLRALSIPVADVLPGVAHLMKAEPGEVV